MVFCGCLNVPVNDAPLVAGQLAVGTGVVVGLGAIEGSILLSRAVGSASVSEALRYGLATALPRSVVRSRLNHTSGMTAHGLENGYPCADTSSIHTRSYRSPYSAIVVHSLSLAGPGTPSFAELYLRATPPSAPAAPTASPPAAAPATTSAASKVRVGFFVP